MDGIILLTRVKGSSPKATFEIEDDPIEEISLSQIQRQQHHHVPVREDEDLLCVAEWESCLQKCWNRILWW